MLNPQVSHTTPAVSSNMVDNLVSIASIEEDKSSGSQPQQNIDHGQDLSFDQLMLEVEKVFEEELLHDNNSDSTTNGWMLIY
jgi:hypothetical protein